MRCQISHRFVQNALFSMSIHSNRKHADSIKEVRRMHDRYFVQLLHCVILRAEHLSRYTGSQNSRSRAVSTTLVCQI